MWVPLFKYSLRVLLLMAKGGGLQISATLHLASMWEPLKIVAQAESCRTWRTCILCWSME